jgi:hypothetical protein
MTRFVKTNAGFIDLAEVAGAQAIQIGRPRPGQRGHRIPSAYTRFLDEAAKEIGVGGALDLERLTSPLVPSSAVVIAITPTGVTTAHPVAAYRVLRAGAAEPAFVVEPPEGATLFQAVGVHGLVQINDGALFPDLAAARKFVTDASHPGQAPVEVEIEPASVMQKALAGKRR